MAEQADIRRISALAADLKRLENATCFSGRTPRPPWETRGRVGDHQALRSRYSMSTGIASGSDAAVTFLSLVGYGPRIRSREGAGAVRAALPRPRPGGKPAAARW
jgi:hypothetical protein